MARIIKTQAVEIGFEEIIKLIKKNWCLLGGFLTHKLLNGNTILRVKASFDLVSISAALRKKEGLIIDVKELGVAINQVFRDIKSQKPYFKNMGIEHVGFAPFNLNVSFDIDIAPVIPVDPLDIELDDLAKADPNRVESDPDKTEARSFMPRPSPSSGNEIYGV
jgi:hypothetical protein